MHTPESPPLLIVSYSPQAALIYIAYQGPYVHSVVLHLTWKEPFFPLICFSLLLLLLLFHLFWPLDSLKCMTGDGPEGNMQTRLILIQRLWSTCSKLKGSSAIPAVQEEVGHKNHVPCIVKCTILSNFLSPTGRDEVASCIDNAMCFRTCLSWNKLLHLYFPNTI